MIWIFIIIEKMKRTISTVIFITTIIFYKKEYYKDWKEYVNSIIINF